MNETRKYKPHIRILKTIVTDPNVTSQEFRLLCVLMSHINTSGECWPSIATLTKEAKQSRNGVVDRIKTLEEKGFISVRQDGRKSIYSIQNNDILDNCETVKPNTIPPGYSIPPNTNDSIRIDDYSIRNDVKTVKPNTLTKQRNETKERDKSNIDPYELYNKLTTRLNDRFPDMELVVSDDRHIRSLVSIGQDEMIDMIMWARAPDDLGKHGEDFRKTITRQAGYSLYKLADNWSELRPLYKSKCSSPYWRGNGSQKKKPTTISERLPEGISEALMCIARDILVQEGVELVPGAVLDRAKRMVEEHKRRMNQ